MLSSRPVQLTTDAPYFSTKTPGRALLNRGENAHTGALSVKLKGKNAQALPRTPFQPALSQHQKGAKPGITTTTTTRLLADKTPLPNRIGAILFQTPLPQKPNVKSSKLAFVDPDGINQTKSMKNGDNKTPDSVQRPSSMRRHVKHPRSGPQNFETPMNRGNHWDISDGDIVLPADMQPALQDGIIENDDLDEIEFMPPNNLNLPYEPPLDFELPDYKILGTNLRGLAHSCPYDDSPSPPELDIIVSDLASSTWDMFKLPPLSLEDDPFHRARAEIAQASGKSSVTSKTGVVTKPGPSLARQPTNHTNTIIPSKITRSVSQPQRALPIASVKSSRPGTATSIGTATSMKGTASKIAKPAPPSMSTTTKSAPIKPTHHKSTVSLSSKPPSAGVVTRVGTSTVRRPQTVMDTNKKHDKPSSSGALMLVNDTDDEGDAIGEDFLFDV